MATTGEIVGLLLIVFANTAVTALLTRFFRVRLKTRWGSVVYVALLVPVVLLIVTLLLGSLFGPDLGSPAAVIGLTILVPFSLGVTFDYVWMPAPEEVEVPDRQRGQVRRN